MAFGSSSPSGSRLTPLGASVPVMEWEDQPTELRSDRHEVQAPACWFPVLPPSLPLLTGSAEKLHPFPETRERK